MRKLRTRSVFIAGAAALALALAPTAAASAYTANIAGSTFTNYLRITHTQVHEKTTTTTGKFQANNLPCAGWANFWLRSNTRNPATLDQIWNSGSTHNFYAINTQPEDGRLKPGSYRFQSLMGGCGNITVAWSGVLTW